jgi:hypothetical protein
MSLANAVATSASEGHELIDSPPMFTWLLADVVAKAEAMLR